MQTGIFRIVLMMECFIVHTNKVLLTRTTVSSHVSELLRLKGKVLLFHFNKGMKLN